MKIYITADMEGVAVLCHDVQVDQKGLDYPRARELMTEEVQAAIDGARSGGADENLVCDAHDTGRTTLAEPLRSAVAVGESGLSAAIAGHFGVPVILVSGDAHAVRQAKSLIKNLVGGPTKEGECLYGVRKLTPARARELIRKGAKEALESIEEILPYTLKKPILVEVEWTRPLMAEYTAHIPLVRRKDIKSVSYKASDMIDAFHVFNVMMKVAVLAKEEGPL